MPLAEQKTDDFSTLDAPYWSRLTRQLRHALCQSQEQFAATMGTNQATVSRWETGDEHAELRSPAAARADDRRARPRDARRARRRRARQPVSDDTLADRSGVIVAASASTAGSPKVARPWNRRRSTAGVQGLRVPRCKQGSGTDTDAASTIASATMAKCERRS